MNLPHSARPSKHRRFAGGRRVSAKQRRANERSWEKLYAKRRVRYQIQTGIIKTNRRVHGIGSDEVVAYA